MVGVLLLTSKGMAGVPGSAFLALSASAAAVGAYPAAAVALMLGADRFMDSMRVFTNLLGNCVATLVVARWENLLDFRQLQVVLSGKLADEEAVGEDVPPVEDKELEGIAHKSEVEALLAQADPASSGVVPAAG
jgi:aerobic C4-dicarboxylate transport protein